MEVREGGPSLRWKSSKLHLCNSTFLGKCTFSSRFLHILTLKSKKVVRIYVNFGYLTPLDNFFSASLQFWTFQLQSLSKFAQKKCSNNRCMIQKKKLMTNSGAFSCLEVQLERGNHSVACIWSAIHSKHTSHIKWSTDECVPLPDLDDHGQDLGGPSGAE